MKPTTFISLFFLLSFINLSLAKENKGYSSNHQSTNKTNAGCIATTAQTDLNINNVRAHILNGGDLWWDYNNNSNGQYEVPINSGKISIYAGAIWIAGYDGSGNLKAAAQTYRQNGSNDFWAGPIAKDNLGVIDVTPSTCNAYDRFWTLTKSQVQSFSTGGASTPDILSWPGNGNVANGELPFLAPFFDVNNNGIYEPLGGDYPYYLFSGSASSCNGYLKGDQTIWWVFNDIGNIHTETGSQFNIGLEIRAQAFAFSSTNTDINNSTFYEYQIINRSNDILFDTYFGVWCDADLGNAADDYVGCDVKLGLGYCYNGDSNDDGASGYGLNPPAVGIDFFQGPLADPNDGIDNDRDGIIDEPGETIAMTKFMYYVNTNGTPIGNPTLTDDYYQYLDAIWLDGSPVTYGGDGKGAGTGATTTPCNFMFPGTSDTSFTQNWTMATSGILPNDVRFLESAGKFTLQPGAVNFITTGVVWARATSGGPMASVDLLKTADSTVQLLFNSCFTIGLNEPVKEITYSIFPNPCHSTSILKFYSAEVKNATLKIYDVTGKVVRELKVLSTNEIVIDKKGLVDGLYIFKLEGDNKAKASGKLMIL